jgi:hypothetical protein
VRLWIKVMTWPKLWVKDGRKLHCGNSEGSLLLPYLLSTRPVTALCDSEALHSKTSSTLLRQDSLVAICQQPK